MPPRHGRGGKPASHRVYQPGKRHMELMPTISRSSGLDRDGDSLKDHEVQEEYRAFVQEKVDAYFEDRGGDERQRREKEQNLLILFRKLREGIQSSNRADLFALDVYETSLHLSIIFHTPSQTTSVLSHLLPDLYNHIAPGPSPSIREHRSLPTVVLSLLHNLIFGYPSQSRYFEQLHSLPRTFMPQNTDAYQWFDQLTRCLRRRNYARLDNLTRPEAFHSFTQTLAGSPPQKDTTVKGAVTGGDNKQDLYSQALGTLINTLREKVRETAWLVIRSAYREITCPPSAESDLQPVHTSQWLARLLVLCPIALQIEQERALTIKVVNEWLDQRNEEGEVQKKDDIQGRWIIHKVGAKT